MLLPSRLRFAGGAGVDSLLDGPLPPRFPAGVACAPALLLPLLAKKSFAAVLGCGCDFEAESCRVSFAGSVGLLCVVEGFGALGLDAAGRTAAGGGGRRPVRRFTSGLVIVP